MPLVCLDASLARKSALDRGGPYIAVSGSTRTDDWPFWYVAGRDGRSNVLEFLPEVGGAVMTIRKIAEQISAAWNGEESNA